MCTRFHLLKEHLRTVLADLGIEAPADVASRYNIAPTSRVFAIRPRAAEATAAATDLEAVTLRWGLTPAWSRSDEPAARLVNARAETVASKPSFRAALRSRRCVIPASGFYEWETVGRAKRPWLFRRRDERPFGFAGLWETWRGPDGTDVESCAIITTTPNAVLQPIHDRMPVMLEPAQFSAWLDLWNSEPAAFAELLRPAPAESMSALAVSRHVSNVRHEGPECIAPAGVEPGDEDPQFSLNW